VSRTRADRKAGGAGLAPVAAWAAIAALALGGATLSGCDIGGGDDDDTPATTPAATTGEPTDTTGASGNQGGGGRDETPEDTGPTVPESGGVGADDYDPEKDSPENDLPPPPGSPQEKFEQACDQNPGLCD
jgi:hypothetical protein